MIKDIIGTVISCILIFLMLVVAPIYYVGIIQWARSDTEVISATRNLIDEVIDTRQLSDDLLADYNLQLAGLPNYYKYTITREVKVVNPDPANPGSTYTTYVAVDNYRTFNQGDIITVKVEPAGENLYQSIAKMLLGLVIPNGEFSLAGRVR